MEMFPLLLLSSPTRPCSTLHCPQVQTEALCPLSEPRLPQRPPSLLFSHLCPLPETWPSHLPAGACSRGCSVFGKGLRGSPWCLLSAMSLFLWGGAHKHWCPSCELCCPSPSGWASTRGRSTSLGHGRVPLPLFSFLPASLVPLPLFSLYTHTYLRDTVAWF